MSERTPIIRYFTLPNGDKIMSLRESTLRAGLKAAGAALREWRTPRPGQGQGGADAIPGEGGP